MICGHCQNTFEIPSEDTDFYEKLNLPSPKECPDCRQLLRLCWRNEYTLYKRKCDGTGKSVLSVFSPDKPFKIYEPEYWYSDQWDALDYGREVDFTRPFFEQFQELLISVPQLARSIASNQNCDYVNQVGWCRNCYLIFEADSNENCSYSNYIYESKYCYDCLGLSKCQYCYQCIDCLDSYNLKYSQNSKNCSDSWFLKDCIGCKDCFGCVNLRNKQYYFLNQPLSKEEYEAKLNQLGLGDLQNLKAMQQSFLDFSQKYPQRFAQGVQNQNCTGNYINNSKECHHCFDVQTSQDSKYLYNCRNIKNSHDITVFGAVEGVDFSYNCHEIGGGVRNIFFSDQIWVACHDIFYSKLCIQSSHDLFGCVGLRHKSYCILNKQYTPEKYHQIKEKLIQHMQATGEWGRFFPKELSPFAYDETVAQDYFPLTKEQAMKKGFKWYQEDSATFAHPDASYCKTCDKPFKITEDELNYYDRFKLPEPEDCYFCRHKDRFKLRLPRKLNHINCDNCQVPLKSPYAQDRTQKVYCEQCYQQASN